MAGLYVAGLYVAGLYVAGLYVAGLYVAGLYDVVLWVMVALAPIIGVILLFITAPYGRYERQGWGPTLGNKGAWFIIEAPASLLMLAVLVSVFVTVPLNPVIVFFLLVWQVHYFHRAFIYPFTLRSDKRMPLLIIGIALVFNTVNAYLNGYHFVLNSDWYGVQWLMNPSFWAGLVVFGGGFFMVKRSDRLLRNLRDPGDTSYQIPRGFMYQWVSCPNYLGECVQWVGWALMTQAPAAWVFVLWTFANLVPRAIAHHRWYREEFPDYPRERKAILPFVF